MNRCIFASLVSLALASGAWGQMPVQPGQIVELTSLPPVQTVYRPGIAPAVRPSGYAAPIQTTYPLIRPAYAAPLTYGGQVVRTGYAPLPVGAVQGSSGLAPVPTTTGGAVYAPLPQTAYGVANYSPLAPNYAARNAPLQPVVSLSSLPANYVVGQGLVGQPKIFVPGQPVRNFFRYLSP